jgi:hypothetical protein
VLLQGSLATGREPAPGLGKKLQVRVLKVDREDAPNSYLLAVFS